MVHGGKTFIHVDRTTVLSHQQFLFHEVKLNIFFNFNFFKKINDIFLASPFLNQYLLKNLTHIIYKNCSVHARRLLFKYVKFKG